MCFSTGIGVFTGTIEPPGGIHSIGENPCPSYSTKSPPVIESIKRSPEPSNPAMEGDQRSNLVVDGRGEFL